MKKFKISRLNLILIISVLVTCVLGSIGAVVAKYVSDREGDKFLSSKSFYFESDYLKEKNKAYSLNSTQNGVDIKLYNFENEWRVSEVDTVYTVSVSSADSGFLIDGESVTEKTYSAEAGEIVTTTVHLTGLTPGAKYEVSATANGGYTKTLSATFTVRDTEDGIYMNVSETSSYVLLTVFTEDSSGTVDVVFPAGLIPDATDPFLSGIDPNYDGESYLSGDFSFDIEAYSSRSFRFFKADNYAAGEISVTVGGAAVPSRALS